MITYYITMYVQLHFIINSLLEQVIERRFYNTVLSDRKMTKFKVMRM
jgi:hypothetical protein